MDKSQILLDVVRQNFVSVVWTHKIQEKQADIYAERYKILETINIIAAALTSCGVFSLITKVNEECLLIEIGTCICSFVTLGITAYFKSFDLKSLEKRHKEAANNFIVIRNELLQIIADVHMGSDDISDIEFRYKETMQRLNKLYTTAPVTSNRARNRAEETFNREKTNSYDEDEIDRFLPSSLKGRVRKSTNIMQ